MKLSEIEFLLGDAWSQDTCLMRDVSLWNENNPSYGQSLVTALAVNDFVGGDIHVCNSSVGEHYFNVIDDRIFDITVKQFNGESILYGNGGIVSRDELLENDIVKDKYFTFLSNIKANLELMTKDIDDVLNSNFGKDYIRKKE